LKSVGGLQCAKRVYCQTLKTTVEKVKKLTFTTMQENRISIKISDADKATAQAAITYALPYCPEQ
jgi:hypothetical protein